MENTYTKIGKYFIYFTLSWLIVWWGLTFSTVSNSRFLLPFEDLVFFEKVLVVCSGLGTIFLFVFIPLGLVLLLVGYLKSRKNKKG